MIEPCIFDACQFKLATGQDCPLGVEGDECPSVNFDVCLNRSRMPLALPCRCPASAQENSIGEVWEKLALHQPILRSETSAPPRRTVPILSALPTVRPYLEISAVPGYHELIGLLKLNITAILLMRAPEIFALPRGKPARDRKSVV